MATYVTLFHFTDKGIQEVADTVARADHFIESAKKAKVQVKDIYWTLGPYDGIVIFEAEGDEAATALMLGLAARGFVKPQTLRAFTRSEIASILPKGAAKKNR